MLHRLVLFLASTSFPLTTSEESSHYLQNAVRGLRNLNFRQTLRRADISALSSPPSITPDSAERRAHHSDDAPPISLTKGELSALYEAAVAKGETIKLDAGDSSYIHAAVHHLDDDESHHAPVYDEPHHNSEDGDGYYYYYYPIKSFLDEITSQPSDNGHSHHNITITKTEPEEKKAKPLEPLFMAISGFIGMAVMLVLSLLFYPKFGGFKPKISAATKKNDRINDIARLALQAIDQDCAERFACELTKTARSFNIAENRFVRLLRRIAPGTFGRHLNKVGKYANKQMKCTAIPCKKKNNNQKKKNNPPQRNKH